MDELIKQLYKVDLSLDDVQALTRSKAKIILYDNLTIDDNILTVIGPTNRAILLFPTESGSPNGHYLCLIYYKDIQTLLHFDSYGLDVQQELRYSTSRHVPVCVIVLQVMKHHGYLVALVIKVNIEFTMCCASIQTRNMTMILNSII